MYEYVQYCEFERNFENKYYTVDTDILYFIKKWLNERMNEQMYECEKCFIEIYNNPYFS